MALEPRLAEGLPLGIMGVVRGLVDDDAAGLLVQRCGASYPPVPEAAVTVRTSREASMSDPGAVESLLTRQGSGVSWGCPRLLAVLVGLTIEGPGGARRAR